MVEAPGLKKLNVHISVINWGRFNLQCGSCRLYYDGANATNRVTISLMLDKKSANIFCKNDGLVNDKKPAALNTEK
jgi:hypothetical protein